MIRLDSLAYHRNTLKIKCLNNLLSGKTDSLMLV